MAWSDKVECQGLVSRGGVVCEAAGLAHRSAWYPKVAGQVRRGMATWQAETCAPWWSSACKVQQVGGTGVSIEWMAGLQ
jgi:hypothetical protein